jgi:3-oxoacyl-(acyl-carrier-protein) synthase
MAERIVVTGIGIISASGLGTEAQELAFRSGKSGIGIAQHLHSAHTPELVLGEVKASNDDLSALLGIPLADSGYTRTALLAQTAFQDLLDTTGILPLLKREPFAFINASTVGGMSTMEHIYMDVSGEHTREENIRYIDTLDCAEGTERVMRHYGLNPLAATISTACSSSSNAIMMGARLLKAGMVQRAICGGSDALAKFTVNGFYSLKNVDKGPMRPFDQNRGGLNIGEAAGYCLLETESAARARGAEILAIVSGYANTNDAYHVTAPSPDGSGAARTMKIALDMAGLQPSDIGYINAHGTATQNNDQAEGLAIQKLFGVTPPPFSSTKPFTGHTLAAAGVVEAIYCIIALQEQIAPPNLNFTTRMEELEISPITTLQEHLPIDHVLSNSFGFGGSNVSLVFSKA